MFRIYIDVLKTVAALTRIKSKQTFELSLVLHRIFCKYLIQTFTALEKSPQCIESLNQMKEKIPKRTQIKLLLISLRKLICNCLLNLRTHESFYWVKYLLVSKKCLKTKTNVAQCEGNFLHATFFYQN